MGKQYATQEAIAAEVDPDHAITEQYTVADLLTSAAVTRARAYNPYSGYGVGAALIMQNDDGDQKTFTGCNVEAVSYSQTTHAEQSALSAAIADGYTDPIALAIDTDAHDGIPPCGHCRQTLIEHGTMPIYTRQFDSDDGPDVPDDVVYLKYELDDLLPFAFGPDNLE